ncbi:MAG: adenine/guanine/hypoxanthine permease, partial [Clostridia bacterium]|nr:adenine/guanine/hypoxanthine permease [Clostridia bacterium]
MLERIFRLKENHTDVRTEIIAGLTTFMTMSYIIFVNPAILKDAGLPFPATMAMTAIAAAAATILMGLYTNYPFAMASGMGLNAVVTYGLVVGMKLPWQVAMGMVFIEGVVITVLVLTNIREAVMNAIPLSLKRAIGVGIGLFIAFIGLKNGGFVVSDPVTSVKLGNFHQPGVIVATIGLVITAFLVARKVKGGILLGILATTVIALFAGVTSLPEQWLTASVDWSTFGKLDIAGALKLSLV